MRNHEPVMTGTKVCKDCKNEQDVTEFYPHKSMSDGRVNKCRTCMKIANNEWRNKPENRSKWNAQRHKKKTIESHGISELEYEILLSQKNCEACGKPKSQLNKGLAFDHDHITGKVRGVLCSGCNLALGNVNDSVETLQGLIDYLQTYHTKIRYHHQD